MKTTDDRSWTIGGRVRGRTDGKGAGMIVLSDGPLRCFLAPGEIVAVLDCEDVNGDGFGVVLQTRQGLCLGVNYAGAGEAMAAIAKAMR